MDYLAGSLTGMDKAKYVLYDKLKDGFHHGQRDPWGIASENFSRYTDAWNHIYYGIQRARRIHESRWKGYRKYPQGQMQFLKAIAADLKEILGNNKPIEVIVHKAPFKQFVLMNCYGSFRAYVNGGHKGWVKVTPRKVRRTAMIKNFSEKSPLRGQPTLGIMFWPDGHITKATEWTP